MDGLTEEPLAGGNVAAAVVRSGDTMRKPWTPATPAVHGRDEQGRQVLAYVPGEQGESAPPMTVAELRRLGAMVRVLHDASVDFVPPPGARWAVAIPPDGAELVCHQDLAPWNLIRDGERGPSSTGTPRRRGRGGIPRGAAAGVALSVAVGRPGRTG